MINLVFMHSESNRLPMSRDRHRDTVKTHPHKKTHNDRIGYYFYAYAYSGRRRKNNWLSCHYWKHWRATFSTFSL